MGWTREKTRPSLPHIDKGLNDIFNLPFAYQPHTRVVYSDLPIILMGKAMEKIVGKPLDDIVNDTIIVPLNLNNTSFAGYQIRVMIFQMLHRQNMMKYSEKNGCGARFTMKMLI